MSAPQQNYYQQQASANIGQQTANSPASQYYGYGGTISPNCSTQQNSGPAGFGQPGVVSLSPVVTKSGSIGPLNGNGNEGQSQSVTVNGTVMGDFCAGDRIMVPKKAWKSSINPVDGEDDLVNEFGDLKDKRGDYKCSKCGEPKRGHVCRNKPRIRSAFIEKREAEVQAQLDPNMTVAMLNRSLQGYPLSYGFNHTWPAVHQMNPYLRHPIMPLNPHAQQFQPMGMHMQIAPSGMSPMVMGLGGFNPAGLLGHPHAQMVGVGGYPPQQQHINPQQGQMMQQQPGIVTQQQSRSNSVQSTDNNGSVSSTVSSNTSKPAFFQS